MQWQNFIQNLIPWFLSHGIKIICILVGSYFLNQFFQVFLGKVIKKKIKDKVNGRKKKKAETLLSVFGGTLRFAVYILAILIILSELGINIAPILAGLGVAGLAIGMAARDILADFISGIFIILENQYEIGDRVKIAGIEGEVKEITLRKTVIVDESGFFHLIPNSQIKIISKKQEGASD